MIELWRSSNHEEGNLWEPSISFHISDVERKKEPCSASVVKCLTVDWIWVIVHVQTRLINEDSELDSVI